MKYRIVKQFNNKSPRNGIVVVDYIDFESPQAAAEFVFAVNTNNRLDYCIIDYERALIGSTTQIIENPTGGRLGKGDAI